MLWETNLKIINKYLERNNFPRLRIITDSNRNIVYIEKFRYTVNSFFDFFCDEDLLSLYNEIHDVKKDSLDNINDIRYSIINSVIKLLPTKI